MQSQAEMTWPPTHLTHLMSVGSNKTVGPYPPQAQEI